MLKGLEITIIKRSEIFADNEEFRIDSEYYRKEYLELYKKIENSPKLNELVYMSDLSTNGSFATVAAIKNDNNPKVIPFIRSGNVGDTFINLSELEFISKEAHENLPKSTTRLHEIMMARKGKIGGASIIMQEQVNYNCNENVIKLDILNKDDLNPFYFTAYFNSKYGLKQIERLSTGNVQPWVSIFQIRKLMIPILDFHFQLQIQKLLEISYNSNLESKYSYEKANDFLLQEIGLQNFEPSKEAVNVKTFKESFGKTKRLDAEYYQKKYDDYSNLIYKYRNGFDKLDSVCNLKDNNFNPSENTLYKYIELSNIGKTGEVNGCTEELGRYLPSRARRLVNTGDVVISSIEGSLQSCAIIPETYNNALCSTGFYVINSERINSETLLILFKSEPLQAIMKQNCSGTILTAMNKDEFLNIPIPLIDIKKQEKIADLVEESFKLKSESERLLEVAKKAVEIAIETDEKTAIKFIKDNEI